MNPCLLNLLEFVEVKVAELKLFNFVKPLIFLKVVFAIKPDLK